MTYYWFIGYDPRDDLASKVAIRSMRKHTKADVEVIPLRDHELRRLGIYWRAYEVRENGQMIDRRDGKPFSTQFSFSRFCAAELARRMNITDPVLFTDADVMFRADIKELFAHWDSRKCAMCVQHDHKPKEETKFDGLEQTRYFRKNWSSVMLISPKRSTRLDCYAVNNWTGAQLHALLWADDRDIGKLPSEWNHLVGYSKPSPKAKLVHFTLGTPDMPGREADEFAKEWRSYTQEGEMPPLNHLGTFTKAELCGWKASGQR